MTKSDSDIAFLTVRLPRREYERLRKAAERDDRAISNWARLRLREAVEERERRA